METKYIGVGFSVLAMVIGLALLMKPWLSYRFEKKDFVRVEFDGSYCICLPGHERDFVEDDGYEYKFIHVRMTQKQFDELAEFDGF